MAQIPPSGSARSNASLTFRAVGAFVPRATAKVREKQGLHAAEIIINWPAIVGPQLSAYTTPRRIRWPKAPDRLGPPPKSASGQMQKTTLEIWVAGGRAHEIPYLKGPIIARINSYFGYRAVTDILPVDGAFIQVQRPKVRAPLSTDELMAAAKAHNLAADDPLAKALAKLGANIKRGRS